MAIAQTGSVQSFSVATTNSGTASSTITVPADCDLVLVGATTFQGSAGYISGGSMTFTKGGTDTAMTSATNQGDSDTGKMYGGLFYLKAPDTGSNKTLKWDFSGTSTPDEEVLISCIFFTGVDQTTTVRDADAEQSSTAPYTTPTLTAQSGDLIVAWAWGWTNPTNGSVDSWSNLTLISNVTSNGNADGAWASSSPSGNTTVGTSTDTNWEDGGIAAVVLIPASGGSVQSWVRRRRVPPLLYRG